MKTKTTAVARYTVIRDSRERKDKGWVFSPSTVCAGTRTAKLDTGDYSLAGYERVFRLERKGCVSEFAANLTQKEKWADFKAELERLETYESPFLILEFDMEALSNYPDGCGLPWSVRKKIRIKPQFLLKRLLEIQLAFRTRVIMAGCRGKEVASSLFKRIVERCPPALNAEPPVS